MNTTTCCFTGHRYLPADMLEHIMTRLNTEVELLIERGVTDFICGGAIGFDLLAASLIAAKKGMGTDVRLIFALPCRNQDVLWPGEQKALYRELLKEADEVRYVSEEYSPGCMRKRNYYMVENSGYCVCAFLNDRSGTSQTVRYALRNGLSVINVAI